MQLAIHMNDDGDEGWEEGRIVAFTRGGARQVHNSSETLLPHFVATSDDMETLEAENMTFSEAARCHQLLTAPGEGISSRFPASIELPPVSALSADPINRIINLRRMLTLADLSTV